MSRIATVRIRKILPGTVPAWVPLPGFAKRIPTSNRINDASIDPSDDPALNPFYPGTSPWNGTLGVRGIVTESSFVYAPDDGPNGSIIIHGGGHGDYGGNEVHRVAVSETPFFERLSDPLQTAGFKQYALDNRALGTPVQYCGWPHINASGGWDPSDYIRSTAAGFDVSYRDWGPTEPLCGHQYAIHQIIPPALGGGSQGSFLRLGCPAPFSALGALSDSSNGSHYFNLNTIVWDRFSPDITPSGCTPSSVSWLDPTRNRVNAIFTGADARRQYLDLSTRVWTSEAISQHGLNLTHMCAVNHEGFDMGIDGAGGNFPGTITLRAIPNGGGNWAQLITTGNPSNEHGRAQRIALTYCPLDHAIYGFSGALIFRCNPPAGLTVSPTNQAAAIAGTWTWEQLFPQTDPSGHALGWDLNSGISPGVGAYNSVGWWPGGKCFVSCRWSPSLSSASWLNLALILFRPDTAL